MMIGKRIFPRNYHWEERKEKREKREKKRTKPQYYSTSLIYTRSLFFIGEGEKLFTIPLRAISR